LVLRRIGRDAAAKAPVAAPAAKVLTAADIVSAFARENQEGAALQRLRGYTLEGTIESAPGESRRVVLHRLRPDRFRFSLLAEGATSFVTAFDGTRYWQQSAGRAAQSVTREAVGRGRYLGEFVDPLFGEGGASFTRLEDGAEAGRPFYRIEVRRSDSSRYVSRIQPETFRQIGQENEDGSVARYSDHREVGGLWIAFREEVTEKDGSKRTFAVNRVTPNPGLIQALFEVPAPSAWNLHALERVFPALAKEGGK
jgi:outer membrane lipoprotein-sorting protein